MDLDSTTPAEEAREKIDRVLAPGMFVVSLLFLVMLAGAIQNLRGDVVLPEGTELYWWMMLALWPLFVGELVLHACLRSPRWKHHLLYCLMPPLRMGGRDHVTGQSIWLPRFHWLRVDRDARKRLERTFSGPMIFFALLVLPVLALEYYWDEQVKESVPLSFFVDTATSLIWIAFTIEFIVMISVVSDKWTYCLKNWVDLVVILLPLAAFVRVLRVAQLAQVSRLSRLYRLRGMSMRAYRAVLVLGLLRYIFRIPPAKRLKALEVLLHERERELDLIRNEIAVLRAKCEEREAPAQPPIQESY